MSTNKHSVFVLSKEGKPLTPTTPAKARKLLRAGVAVKRWSKFNTFGIQLTIDSRTETPDTALGVDNGTKYEGYSVVVGRENVLNVKLDLPDKKVIVRKLQERRRLRRARRWRNCRRRPSRFNNRRRTNWLAPSQDVVVNSRLKVIRECFNIYPINFVGFEDVCFNHAKKHWGANFSTVEIGKKKIKAYFKECGAKVFEYKGWQTKELREKYGYQKTSVKSADEFTAHCSDSLALAVDIVVGDYIDPGPFLIVDDTYRCNRRKLHDTQPSKEGIRDNYSRGTVFGLRKGLLIGLPNGKIGQLCGEYKGNYRYYTTERKRGVTKKITWVSSNFVTRGGVSIPLPDKSGSTLDTISIWKKELKLWQAQIMYSYKPIKLGCYDSEYEAAIAYDKKAYELWGEYARTNFPPEMFLNTEVKTVLEKRKTSKYKGVDYLKGKWRVRILGKHVGMFESEKEAYVAYGIAKEMLDINPDIDIKELRSIVKTKLKENDNNARKDVA